MRLTYEQVTDTMQKKLTAYGTPDDQADLVSKQIARNSLEGVYTHGINRFPRLIYNIKAGIVKPGNTPKLMHSFQSMENYDGQLGLGIVNATFCMQRAMELAAKHGIGLVALRNTNHWFRAATYGYQACDAGYAALCFTNTVPNMPTWGAVDSHLGNNPFMMAFPKADNSHVIVDSAMSQFSYGALELAKLEQRDMPIDAGFDSEGNLTRNPEEVIKTQRILPTGYWKGAAMSFVLDMFAASLSLGNSVSALGKQNGDEHGVSQMFIAIDYGKIADRTSVETIVDSAIQDLKSSTPDTDTKEIVYPGERPPRIRRKNLEEGIPVDESVWNTILAL
ncbi:MAG: 3-dehydro-L-gulonate 2-dehydrogenase [Sphaerochaetaceae bacterium]|jgi:3-dehydro-L-gulonate 2-dehydrogenase